MRRPPGRTVASSPQAWFRRDWVRPAARASRVVVRIEDERDLLLTVRDDGVGFDAQEVAQRRSGHFGLSIMQERAQRAGAELTIGPAAPYGTQVTVRLAQRDRLSA